MWFKKAIFLMMLAIMVLAIVVSAFANDAYPAAQLKAEIFESGAESEFASAPVLQSIATIRDVTAEYSNVYAHSAADWTFASYKLKDLKQYKVIFVTGLMTNVGNKSPRIFGFPPLPEEYFYQQAGWLRAHNVEYERAPINTQASVEVNGFIIAEIIKASDKPVILIGHCGGGLHILETLISYPEQRAKIRGVLMVQTPFYSSPAMDYIVDSGFLHGAMKLMLKHFDGDENLLTYLTVKARTEYMRKNEQAILEATAAVPVISIATWKEPCEEDDTIFKPMRDMLLEAGIVNDGMLGIESTMLPGADLVKLGGLDHLDPVFGGEIPGFSRTQFFKALLTMLLERSR